MGLSCGMNLTKMMMFAFNFLFWVMGIILLGVGIYSRIEGGSLEDLVKDGALPNAANLMIASGIFVALIGFLGCCGALKKHRCMLISYSILIFMIFILELAAGIYAYSKKDTVQNDLEKNLTKVVSHSYSGPTKSDKGLTKAVDWFQKKLKCCGAAGPEDWPKSASWNKTTNAAVPDSCCKVTGTGNCKNGTLAVLKAADKIWTKGCVGEGKIFVKDNLYKVGGAVIVIGIIQLLGIIFACCLCKAIQEEEHTA